MGQQSTRLLIGTYTESLAHVDGKAAGVYTARYDDGALSDLELSASIRNPSWVTTSFDDRFVYAVVETVDFEGGPGGGIAAYARDPDTDALTPLNTVRSAGVEPGHLTVDPTGQFLAAMNYRSGSIVTFDLAADGAIGNMLDQVQHTGSSAHPIRQTSPHPHQLVFDPVTGLLLVPDLGLDSVFFYKLGDDGHLSEQAATRFVGAAGAGPRHLAFHPDQDHIFLLNELDNTLVVLRRKGDSFLQTGVASTLPSGFTGHSQAAAVRVSPSGHHVFTSNRGPDSIAVFAFDAPTGSVELTHLEPSRGSEPRDFVLTHDGSHLLVANQNSDSIITFALDDSGSTFTYQTTFHVPTPVCLRFLS
jgi:6-phosphogluconolactonase